VSARAALVSTFASAVAALAACTSESIDPMERQPRFERYGATALFPDGRQMRSPPEGTVPRERLLGSRAFLTGAGADNKPVDTIPIPITRELLDLGRHRFEVFCAACHGLVGDGDSIVARNMSLRRPPSLLPPGHEHPAGHFFRVITEGYGLMAPYSTELDTRERWAVVAYLRALQLSQSARLEAAPPEERARLSAMRGDRAAAPSKQEVVP
jgi:mono/diheme cytochrome c family protein